MCFSLGLITWCSPFPAWHVATNRIATNCKNFGSLFPISFSMFAVIPAWKWCSCMQCLQYISNFFNFLQALEQQLVQLLEQVLYLVRFVLILNQPHALTLLWLENWSGKRTKLHTVVARNNRDHTSWSLYCCPTYKKVVFLALILFMVHCKCDTMPTASFQQQHVVTNLITSAQQQVFILNKVLKTPLTLMRLAQWTHQIMILQQTNLQKSYSWVWQNGNALINYGHRHKHA